MMANLDDVFTDRSLRRADIEAFMADHANLGVYFKGKYALCHTSGSQGQPALVVQVGATQLRYHARCVDDLHAMLRAHGDWLPLGGADEQKPAANGTVEAWARASTNPVGGWYGLKKGLRGRFAVYVPPVLEALGLAEVEHAPRNNRMRALARPR